MTVKFHSDAAERAVIAMAVVSPETIAIADLEPCHFRHPARAKIWQQLLTMRAMGRAIDEVSVDAAYVESNEHVRAEWAECLAFPGSSSLVGDYSEEIRRHAISRSVLLVLSEGIQTAKLGKESGHELLTAVQGALARLGTVRKGRTREMRTLISELFTEIDDAIARRQRGEDVVRGVPTGIRQWDDWGGIHRGICTVMAGRPGMGKSSVAQQVTATAVERGYGVHVFSLEDSWQSYVSRALSRESGVPVARIRGNLQKQDMRRLAASAGRLCQWQHFGYEDVSTVTGAQVVAAVRREKERLGTKLVVVDYLQLMRRPERGMSKQDALDANITELARAAGDDDMAYLVLSQLSRQTERRADKRPELDDLRGAGEIEERAKCVVGVFRAGYYPGAETDDELELLVLKSNDGPTGVIKVGWNGECTRVIAYE